MLTDQLAQELLKGQRAKEIAERIYPNLQRVEDTIIDEFKTGDPVKARAKWDGFQAFVTDLYTEINTGNLAQAQLESIQNESASVN